MTDISRCPNCLHECDDMQDVEVYSHSETQEEPQVWICSECDFVGTTNDFCGLTSVQRELFT